MQRRVAGSVRSWRGNHDDPGTLYEEYLDTPNLRRLEDVHRFAHDDLIFDGMPVTRHRYIASIAAHLRAVPDLCWQTEDMVVDRGRFAVRLLDRGSPAQGWLGLRPTGAATEAHEYAF